MDIFDRIASQSRKSASDVLNDLEMRIARLERSAMDSSFQVHAIKEDKATGKTVKEIHETFVGEDELFKQLDRVLKAMGGGFEVRDNRSKRKKNLEIDFSKEDRKCDYHVQVDSTQSNPSLEKKIISELR